MFMRLAGAALLACCLYGAAAAAPPAAQPAQRPNIVIILADDLGYGDLGVQGGKDIATPRIDKLAAEGVRLTDYYANHPVCAPSRAALMTGRYQQRFGFEDNPGPALEPGFTPPPGAPALAATAETYGLPLDEPTLPERLKKLGYATAMFGKWHIGFVPEKRPNHRGFDNFYGFLGGAMAYVPDGPTGTKQMLRNDDPAPMPEHTTEAFAAEAVAFIEANKSKPFFLYVPFNAVHAPMQSTKRYLERFASEPDRKRRAHLAMLAALDDATGSIVDAIDKNGLGKSTLVVFISDNGGPTWQTTSANGPLNGVKALVLEGGIRVPAIFRWPGAIPAGKTISSVAMEFDVTATALALAGAASDGKKLDGVSLMPFLTGAKAGDAHPALFWRANQQGAMRQGQWKLVKAGDDYFLFDLSKDIGEHHDLAKEQPKKLAELKAAWSAWSGDMMAAKWRRNGVGEEAAQRRAVEVNQLIARYIRGEPVEPEKLLYGGGPE